MLALSMALKDGPPEVLTGSVESLRVHRFVGDKNPLKVRVGRKVMPVA